MKIEKCYVGVTCDLRRRFKQHSKSKYTIGKTIRHYKWTFDDNVKVIFSGPSNECYFLEHQLRPNSFIGLNEASGGEGGFTSYTATRSAKISKANKGVPKSIEHRKKLSLAAKEKLSGGTKNPNQREWKISDKNGKLYIVDGSLRNFCDQNNIQLSILRKHIGSAVPQPKLIGYGGFRASKKCSLEKRLNTVGWKILEMRHYTT